MKTVAISVCKKTETSIRVRGPQGGALISYTIPELNMKKKDFYFLPSKSSANERLSQLGQ